MATTPTSIRSPALQTASAKTIRYYCEYMTAFIPFLAILASIILGSIILDTVLLLVAAVILYPRNRRRESQPLAPPSTPIHRDSPVQTFAGKVNPVDAIPIIVYSRDEEDVNSCAICLEELEEGEEVKVLPRCEHVFHTSCADEWLAARSDLCPLCRNKVFEEIRKAQFIQYCIGN